MFSVSQQLVPLRPAVVPPIDEFLNASANLEHHVLNVERRCQSLEEQLRAERTQVRILECELGRAHRWVRRLSTAHRNLSHSAVSRLFREVRAELAVRS